MSILNVEHLSHGFGDRAIFTDVSFRLLKGEHIGLVGANGEGKSTFMSIITNKLMPDEGKIEWAKNVRVGYLDQHASLVPGMTIRETLRTAFDTMMQQEKEMLAAYDKMSEATPEEMERLLQDVGLNGLSSDEEKEYPAYQDYLNKLRQKLNAVTLTEMENDPLQLSPFFDPAGDKFHYFRGSDYDSQEVDILTRYKRYNGTEGNSKDINDSGERYSTSSKTVPDVEDINQDNTLNKNEKYFEYKVRITPQDTVVGENFIADKRTSSVRLADGTTESVTWYQFKIPVKQYQRRVGAINDFKTIRFMRMYMTGFKESVVLRFGTLQLVRGEWRSYEQDLSDPKMPPAVKGKLEVSTVNIEENSDRDPVSYTLPPGVSRVLDPSQPQIRQENEQALSLKITDLAAQDARAVYKNPEFIFFDEATNALDANNEREIMEHLHEFYKGKTVVVVAHRLSTVRDADNIIVLDKGKIAEEGTHKELVERKGLYYRLVKNQLELGN